MSSTGVKITGSTSGVRICEGTMEGKDLRESAVRLISEEVGFLEGETIDILWMEADEFEELFVIPDNVFVGLTNMRIFKIDKGSLSCRLLSEIVDAKYEDRGPFYWDKIIVRYKKSEVNKSFKVDNTLHDDTFCIRHTIPCKFFFERLYRIIHKKPYVWQID